MGFYTYTKLFNCGVSPILDYGSEIWGYRKFKEIDSIQNKAIRIYLGVHKFAPLAAINGDMGWSDSNIRRKIAMIRLWNRILKMEPNRLPSKMLMWDLAHTGKTWSSEIKAILTSVDMTEKFHNRETICLTDIWTRLHAIHFTEWKNETMNKPKLRSYVEFKDNYETEPYVLGLMSRGNRSFLAQLRCGILPLELETGRWYNIAIENRKC